MWDRVEEERSVGMLVALLPVVPVVVCSRGRQQWRAGSFGQVILCQQPACPLWLKCKGC